MNEPTREELGNEILNIVKVHNGIDSRSLMLKIYNHFGINISLEEYHFVYSNLLENNQLIELRYCLTDNILNKTLIFEKKTKFLNLQEIISANDQKTNSTRSQT